MGIRITARSEKVGEGKTTLLNEIARYLESKGLVLNRVPSDPQNPLEEAFEIQNISSLLDSLSVQKAAEEGFYGKVERY